MNVKEVVVEERLGGCVFADGVALRDVEVFECAYAPSRVPGTLGDVEVEAFTFADLGQEDATSDVVLAADPDVKY